jgi:hypothetical protein
MFLHHAFTKEEIVKYLPLSTLPTRAALSVLLCILTFFLVHGLNFLPYSPSRDAITDGFAFPGALVASLFYPEGVHSSRGGSWAFVVVASNVAFYSIVWFCLIQAIERLLRQRQMGARR